MRQQKEPCFKPPDALLGVWLMLLEASVALLEALMRLLGVWEMLL